MFFSSKHQDVEIFTYPPTLEIDRNSFYIIIYVETLFDEMHVKDVTWNMMISGYFQLLNWVRGLTHLRSRII